MLETKQYHKRYNLSLEIGDQKIALPVRKVVAENIKQQVIDGIPFEFNRYYFLKLDILLNYSLEKEYQAPTSPQVNLILAMIHNLDIEVSEQALSRKIEAGEFITRNRNAFDAACQTEDI